MEAKKPKCALIIVDVQNDFCPGGALAVPNGDKVVEPINKLLRFAKDNNWVIAATRDWHPETTSHFAKDGGKWPVHCVQWTKGAKFHPDLEVYLYDVNYIVKGTNPGEDAYSGFDGRHYFVPESTLLDLLQRNGVERVYVCGLATDYCIKATALDAVKKRFWTYLVADACRAVNINPDDGKNAIIEMLKAGVLVTTSDFVLPR
jgi:nicotinamidase/pyrazinamidase